MQFASYQIPDSLKKEIDELETLIAAFRKGSVSENELKARRVPFGVYEQRKRGLYMVRVRCTAGIITPYQLKRVAELSLRFASGSLHITTRQEVQIHDVAIDDLVPIIRALADVGLSSRGGGGNTVRNITAPWSAGVDAREIFDVTPYAIALTSALIARSDSWLLPRKYKIAFSSSDKDTTFASVQDLGFFAQIKDGQKGFRVFVAGGMGRQSETGHLLHDFVPTSEIFLIAEAIKRLFSKHGNRKNKHAARLRFLWSTLGQDKFIALYNEERNTLQKEGLVPLEIHDIVNKAIAPLLVAPQTEIASDFQTWKSRYVGEQQQPDTATVRIPILFGIISAEKIKAFADALIPFGENTIRFTHDQNIALRNIPVAFIGNIHAIARKVSSLSDGAPLFGNAVACAGASTCQLGICRSRDALESVIDRLKTSSINLDNLGDLRIHVSGCSNSCGQHIIADLGFYGKVGRKDQHSFPGYNIVAGAVLDSNGNTQLAEKIDEISARDLPVFVENILEQYHSRKTAYSGYSEYLVAEGYDTIRKTADTFRDIPSFEDDRSYYRDWGDTGIFSLAGKGTGECSAGLFDLIEIDLAKLRQVRLALEDKEIYTLRAQSLFDLALISARVLLITRGTEGSSESEVFDKFLTLFIGEKLVDARFAQVIETAANGKKEELVALESEVIALSHSVEDLYAGMDNSLQFKPAPIEVTVSENSTSVFVNTDFVKADLFKDFRGVACPMNFVKTKMALSQLTSGQVLEITLDDGAPIDNVPKSVAEEGHAVLSSEKINDYWRVLIKKQ
jgi:sulfite reductase (ferredoxin)